MQLLHVDVVVIGGGIVGTAVLHEVARHGLRAVLLERELDVCEGTSKANSGIVHTGFDARPGTLEARLLAEARELWPELAYSLRIPYLRCGAVMLALDREQMDRIATEVVANAAAQGVPVQLLSAEAVRARVPAVNPAVVGGLFIPGEAITDPFQATRAFAEAAAEYGAQIRLGEPVVGLEPGPGGAVRVRTPAGGVVAEWVVNAAGLWADEVARLAGDLSFSVAPRKGEFLLVEEDHGIAHILLPVPTPVSKGVLVTPVVFGGLLLGPTAQDVEDKRDRSTTPEGTRRVREAVGAMVPALRHAPAIRQFAGVRAVSSTGDYVIGPSPVLPRLIHAAGIRSTGISSAPAVAREVLRVLRSQGASVGAARAVTAGTAPRAAGPAGGDGAVICLCRAVTRGEVVGALTGTLPPLNLDGVKRRTGAMLGLCQGNLCACSLLHLMAECLGVPPERIAKHAPGSEVLRRRAGTATAPPPGQADLAGPDVPEGDVEVDVVVVGAGLAGLAAARAAAQAGVRVLVLEWSERPGGFLRPAFELPCLAGAREALQRMLAGWPGGAELRLGHTATGLLADYPARGRHAVTVRFRRAVYRAVARYVIVATGSFATPRERLGIPGDRPAGVVTADFVHRALELGYLPGERVILYGSGPYARETGARLADAGAEVVAFLDPAEGSRIAAVRGAARVEGVVAERDGVSRWIPCDTVVVAAGVTPNALWLKGTGVAVDPCTGAVRVNAAGETSLPRVFAAGTCTDPDPLHGRSLAQGEAVGREVARRIREGQ